MQGTNCEEYLQPSKNSLQFEKSVKSAFNGKTRVLKLAKPLAAPVLTAKMFWIIFLQRKMDDSEAGQKVHH